jgi:hypothetical protein
LATGGNSQCKRLFYIACCSILLAQQREQVKEKVCFWQERCTEKREGLRKDKLLRVLIEDN